MSDDELLRDFVQRGAQAAFTTLVERHLNLVYSVALRQVRSVQLAEEVAQSVFVDLARDAARVRPGTPIVAWLHVVCRRKAIDLVRRESRRHAREQAAARLHHMNSSSPESDWSAIEPLLDEAVGSLAPPDRAAILLRFFENKSLREVGAALSMSDDAAQKRVSRAIDQMRRFFMHRGVAVSVSGLATNLSAHAIAVAPAGLGLTISQAAPMTAAAIETSPILAMTTVQKSIAVAVVTLVGGAGLFQGAVYLRQSAELARLRGQSASLAHDTQAMRESDEARRHRLAAVDAQIDARLAPASSPRLADPQLEGMLATWFARAARLREMIAARPELGIPELRLLTDEHWIEIASKSPPHFDAGADEAIKDALAIARKTAESLFAPQLQRALSLFLRASSGTLPRSLYELLPYFESPIAPTLLARYHLVHRGRLDDVSAYAQGNRLIETREVIDLDRDNVVSLGNLGWGVHSASSRAHTSASAPKR